MVPPPGSESTQDQTGLREQLADCFGEHWESIESYLISVAANRRANPRIISPPNATPYPAGVNLLTLVQTDISSINYSVHVYKHPNVMAGDEIFSYIDIAGNPLFGAEFPGYLFEAGNKYRIHVEAYPNPGDHNSHFIDVIIFNPIPTYLPDCPHAMIPNENRKNSKASSKSGTKATTKPKK